MEKNNLKIIANNGRTNSEIKKHQKNLQLAYQKNYTTTSQPQQ